ncbi:hypothetical protein Tco_1105829 [Tanacetum coccineum]
MKVLVASLESGEGLFELVLGVVEMVVGFLVDDSSLIKGVLDGVFGELDNFDVFIKFDEDIFLLVNEVEDEENVNDNKDDLGYSWLK